MWGTRTCAPDFIEDHLDRRAAASAHRDHRPRVEGLAGRVEELTGQHDDLAAVASEQIAPEAAALQQFRTDRAPDRSQEVTALEVEFASVMVRAPWSK